MHNLLFSVSLALLVQGREAIKMKGVKSEAGLLYTDRGQELRCDYIKWKQEQLFSVTWSLEYPGVRTQLLEYSHDGTVTSTQDTSSWVVADRDSATDKTVELRVVGDQGEEEVRVCCEVKVLSDSGYGHMQALKKEKCADFKIVNEPQQPLEVSMYASHTAAEVGDAVDLVCSLPDHRSPRPDLVILVNGVEVGSLGSRDTLASRAPPRLEAALEVAEEHFYAVRKSAGYSINNRNSLVPGEISAECQARFGRRVVASDSLQIERRARHQQPVNQRTQNSWGSHTQHSHAQSQHLAQPQHSLAQHQHQHSRGGREQWTQTGGPHSSASPAPRLTYLLLEATHRGGCLLLGPVSGEVLEDLRSPVPTREGRLELESSVVTVLNTLGHHGYSVAGVGNTVDNRMVWTLAR